MKNIKISNQELKGFKDWYPEEMLLRSYIFSKWREVCLSYGFSEYLGPLLENANIYRAKSGEDIGGKELMVFVDQGSRELAIRPEMTPSVVRMVSKIYQSSVKPLKLFSIANFIRNEKPQRGRNREFWQLNCDVFGDKNNFSDLEILQMSIDIMLAFNPPKDSFILKINHRELIDYIFSWAKLNKDQSLLCMRLMDKYNKIAKKDFINKLKEISLKDNQIEIILKYINSNSLKSLTENIPGIEKSQSFEFLSEIFDNLNSLGYGQYIEFSPDIIRGFDYYDALVFELFDKHPDNNRAMFGGGRYNGLANIFGSESFPAIGFAPGDETFKLFLESWKILPKFNIKKDFYFFPILDESLKKESLILANKLRKEGKKVELSFNVQKISKSLDYANKNGFSYVVIFAEEEFKNKQYKIKDMLSGEENLFQLI